MIKTILFQNKTLSVEETMVLYLFSEKLNYEEITKNLIKKGLTNEKNILTKLGIKVLEKQTQVKSFKEEDIVNLAKQYRLKFKGLKAGAMGNENLLIEKLKEFKKNHKYTDKQILEAIQNYINSEAKSGFQYLQKADYTVSKIVNGFKESRLLTFCEELNDSSTSEEDFYEVI